MIENTLASLNTGSPLPPIVAESVTQRLRKTNPGLDLINCVFKLRLSSAASSVGHSRASGRHVKQFSGRPDVCDRKSRAWTCESVCEPDVHESS